MQNAFGDVPLRRDAQYTELFVFALQAWKYVIFSWGNKHKHSSEKNDLTQISFITYGELYAYANVTCDTWGCIR